MVGFHDGAGEGEHYGAGAEVDDDLLGYVVVLVVDEVHDAARNKSRCRVLLELDFRLGEGFQVLERRGDGGG